jgi:glycosidase
MEGYHDPFCRFPYPWGREDAELLEHYRMLGALRREHEALHGGDFRFVSHGTGYFMFERRRGEDLVLTAVNLDVKPHVFHTAGNWVDLMSDTPVHRELLLESGRCAVLVKNKKLPK